MISIISCTKDNPISEPPLPRPPSVIGFWTDKTVPISIYLLESDGVITGSGTILEYYQLSVKGKNQYPNINFSIGTYGYVPATFTGRFAGKDSMVGSLTGNIFNNLPTALVRE